MLRLGRKNFIVLRTLANVRIPIARPLVRILPSTSVGTRFYSSAPNVEKHEFQTETKSLLDIVAKSLYSEQEVFNVYESSSFYHCINLLGLSPGTYLKCQ